jgi:hypothetical protein
MMMTQTYFGMDSKLGKCLDSFSLDIGVFGTHQKLQRIDSALGLESLLVGRVSCKTIQCAYNAILNFLILTTQQTIAH